MRRREQADQNKHLVQKVHKLKKTIRELQEVNARTFDRYEASGTHKRTNFVKQLTCQRKEPS